jgi:hypothetical protein
MGAAKKKVGPPRKNPNCPLELERLELGETLEVRPQQEYLLEVATRLPLTPRQLADEIRARGAGLRAVSIMRAAPSWWPVLDTNSAYHLHLVFEGKEPQLFPLPGKVKRMWLVRLPPRDATPEAPQLPAPASVPPEALPQASTDAPDGK